MPASMLGFLFRLSMGDRQSAVGRSSTPLTFNSKQTSKILLFRFWQSDWMRTRNVKPSTFCQIGSNFDHRFQGQMSFSLLLQLSHNSWSLKPCFRQAFVCRPGTLRRRRSVELLMPMILIQKVKLLELHCFVINLKRSDLEPQICKHACTLTEELWQLNSG